MSHSELLSQLLAPIASHPPAGQDLSYSPLFDQIRDARRFDDPALSQGDWAQTLKTADWNKVTNLCEAALRDQTKDLQLAVWYAEALVKTRGFAGAQFGLQFVTGLLDQYWESGYPEFDAHDLDERVGKLESFNLLVGNALRQVAITDPRHGGYTWHQWQESREVENIGLKDSQARENAIAEGKLAGDVFDKGVNASGAAWFNQLHSQLEQINASYQALDQKIDERFGHSAPSLAELRNALNACLDVVNRLRAQWGTQAATAPATPAAAPLENNAMSNQAPATVYYAAPASVQPVIQGPIQSRADAVRQLNEVARYFRQHEPHSPVALLAERAAKWAEMSLEEWLGSVIKDDSTLSQLNELLDINRN